MSFVDKIRTILLSLTKVGLVQNCRMNSTSSKRVQNRPADAHEISQSDRKNMPPKKETKVYSDDQRLEKRRKKGKGVKPYCVYGRRRTCAAPHWCHF